MLIIKIIVFLSLSLCSHLAISAVSKKQVEKEVHCSQNQSTAGFADFICGGKAEADLSRYYFTRDTQTHLPLDQTAFSAGGGFSLLSGRFFKLLRTGVTGYTAQPLGLNSFNPLKVDKTLPGRSLSVLGQSFLQLDSPKFMVLGGNILIDTPWISPSDNRMIPSTYSALYGSYNIVNGLSLMGLRLFRFKSHVDSNFTRNNLYSPNEVGGLPIEKLADVENKGALAFGLNHENFTFWHYQFYDYSTMVYGHIGAAIPIGNSGIHGILKAQVLKESASGNNFIYHATNKDVGFHGPGSFNWFRIPPSEPFSGG